MSEPYAGPQESNGTAGERAFAYHILRYTPNLVRDEWVNIGVLLFAPETGERRLQLIQEQQEFNRVRRLHPQADVRLACGSASKKESVFRNLRFPAIPCASTSDTGATERAGSCKCFRSAARTKTSKIWPIRPSASPPKPPGNRSLPQ